MAAGDLVAGHEELVRALYSPLWSPELKRATTLAFTQTDASVSRTAVLTYPAIVEIFKKDLGAELVGTCQTSAGVVLAAAESDKELLVRVVEDPVEAAVGVTANPSHAEIRARRVKDPATPVGLSKAIARQILKVAVVKMIE